MMNPYLPDRYLHDPNKSDEENEIQELFYRQYKTAHSELVMTSMNIYTWRERTIQFIHQYADEQIRILQDDFRRLDGLLQVNLQETLDTVRAYREVNDNNLFVQLRNECRQLKLQVAQLENVDSKMEFPRVTTIEEQRRREEQKKANADRPNSDLQVKQSETTVQNELNEGSSIDHEQRKQQPTADNRQTTLDKSVANSSTTTSDNQHETCYMCFMIYPLDMTQQDRRQHVQDHFPDD